MKSKPFQNSRIEEFRFKIDALLGETANLRDFRELGTELERAIAAFDAALADIDPVEKPASIFDPGNPKTVGFFCALALTAQKKVSLSELNPFYGAGIYALYYNGDFPMYAPIRGTETPIYVGMAIHGGRTTKGTPLAARLMEHRKNIQRASSSLDLKDFSCRALVVQSGWEAPAESYLIRMFTPIWNREVNILYGFGKHGDSVKTRANKRSPWDTLHEGRNWAKGEGQIDAKSEDDIRASLNNHFEKTRIFKTKASVLDDFLMHLQQA